MKQIEDIKIALQEFGHRVAVACDELMADMEIITPDETPAILTAEKTPDIKPKK